MAVATTPGKALFDNFPGPQLGVYDLIDSVSFAGLGAMALKEQQNVALHAG